MAQIKRIFCCILLLSVLWVGNLTAFSEPVNSTEEKVILTPRPGPEPKINGPEVYGCRPGHPFIYRIPCTGMKPVTFAAADLPKTLHLDASTGIITGTVPEQEGDYAIHLSAKNQKGSAKRKLTLKVGQTLALTPPMGWNHWYTFFDGITDVLFREAADSMIANGMADYGYQYINIDDCWMMKEKTDNPKLNGPARDAKGILNPNKNFPDMKALTDYIHSKGLRAGLYTSPGPLTCGGYFGAYQHEEQDAKLFADWGFDFLKYDWCSYANVAGGTDTEHLMKPYQQMGDILKKQNRDIVFNLCQYGMGDVWKWGGKVGGHCWRTTDDLGNDAGDKNLPGFYNIGFINAKHPEASKPGEWNDPDYILIGIVGNVKMTSLTPNEQYSYMSMWCLMAAPLIYSGDIRKMDEFSLNVLCNTELIAVDQDVLGIQAPMLRKTADEFIMAKKLADGSMAVGLFNISKTEREISVSWDDLKIKGKQQVRDLWRQKDTGVVDTKYSAKVPRHGVQMIRLIAK